MSFALALEGLREASELLTPYATTFRYPGPLLEPTASEVEEARAAAARMRDEVKALIPPECHD